VEGRRVWRILGVLVWKVNVLEKTKIKLRQVIGCFSALGSGQDKFGSSQCDST
jgi:hypothetical protein